LKRQLQSKERHAVTRMPLFLSASIKQSRRCWASRPAPSGMPRLPIPAGSAVIVPAAVYGLTGNGFAAEGGTIIFLLVLLPGA